jgi:pseudo-response regulator 5
MEAESADMQNTQGLSQMKCVSASNLSNTDMEKHGGCAKLDQESVLPESENGGLSYYLFWLSFFLY